MPTVEFLPLDSLALGVLKYIAQSSPSTHFPIDDTEKELPRVLDHLEQLGYIKKGEAPLEALLGRDEGDTTDPDKDYWDITATGRAFLTWQEQQKKQDERQEKKEEKQEKQQHTENTRDWLSLTVSAIALIVSIIALVLK